MRDGTDELTPTCLEGALAVKGLLDPLGHLVECRRQSTNLVRPVGTHSDL